MTSEDACWLCRCYSTWQSEVGHIVSLSGYYRIAQDNFRLMVFLLHPGCWDHRCGAQLSTGALAARVKMPVILGVGRTVGGGRYITLLKASNLLETQTVDVVASNSGGS